VNIVEALKMKPCRLKNGDKWMYWNPVPREWFVVTRKHHARKNITLYRGPDEAAAVAALVGG